MNERHLNRIFAVFIFLISTFVYLKTIAPTTSFWDCGEFIACSYILGVAHPPGAPLYILIGRIFSMIPFAEDIGLRVNIISAITSGLTVMLVYLIIIRFIRIFCGVPENVMEKIILFASGIIGSLFYAFTDTFWFNAVEAEVYAISMFFTSIVIWLILVWYDHADQPDSDRYILMLAYCVGLAIGVHLLNILALPAIGFIFYFRKYKYHWRSFLIFTILFITTFHAIYPGIVKWIPNLAYKFSGWFLLIVLLAPIFGIYYAIAKHKRFFALAISSFLLILMGTSTYMTIYIRSNLNPSIDENNPENLKNFVGYLNRDQYGDWGYMERRAPLWEYQIKKMYLRYFGWQFIGKGTSIGADNRIVENFSIHGLMGLPFLLGLIGMVYHFKNDWIHASAIGILFIMTGLAVVIYLNQENPQPRERDYVYAGSFFAFTIWIGIGINAVLDWVKKSTQKSPLFQKTAFALTFAFLVIVLPINTIAFNYRSHDRTGNYVAYDYSYNILQSCEPNAILFTNGDNDTFPLWFLQNVYGIRDDVRVVNLSLLNTSWYIKQLKHEYPKVPMTLSDSSIETLGPALLPKDRRLVRIKVPKSAYYRDLGEVVDRKELIEQVDEVPEINFELNPTLFDRAIRVQDIMILNIIQANQFQRPIYFALTVSPESMLNMDKYLRMDGLTFKLVTYPGERISASKLNTNLLEKFQYRGLNDSTIYFNENIKALLRNYQQAFLSLAQYYNYQKLNEKELEVIDKLNNVMPDTVIPMHDVHNYYVGLRYYQAGRKEEFKKRIDKILQNGKPTLEDKIRYASIYAQIFNEKIKAESIVIEIIAQSPHYVQAYSWLLSFYHQEKQYEKGIKLLNDWLVHHPDDSSAINQMAQLQKLALPGSQ